jgi:hypothetical protein
MVGRDHMMNDDVDYRVTVSATDDDDDDDDDSFSIL